MANITVPINVNLPDDWIEQIVNRLRNDPDADWAEVVRCKDCIYSKEFPDSGIWCDRLTGTFKVEKEGYCKWAKI